MSKERIDVLDIVTINYPELKISGEWIVVSILRGIAPFNHNPHFYLAKSAKSPINKSVFSESYLTFVRRSSYTDIEAFNKERQKHQDVRDTNRVQRSKPPFKPTKLHYICHVLLTKSRPMIREEILEEVHHLEGKPTETFRPTSNGSYFQPTLGFYKKETILTLGLVKVSGKTKTGKFLYELTPKGVEEAMKCEEWLAR